MKLSPVLLAAALAGAASLPAAAAVDFTRDVKPLLEVHCLKCHGGTQAKGGLKLDTLAAALQGGDGGAAITPGNPAKSPLFTTTVLPADDDAVMPPKKEQHLTKEQTDLLKAWITEGAKWPADAKLAMVRRVDFVKDIQPLFEFNCVACHREGHDKGGLRMDNRADTFKGGDAGKGIIPGKPKESLVYTVTTLAPDDDNLMPPAKKGGPLKKEEIELIAGWIEQGAYWPEGVKLTGKKKEEAGGDEAAVVAAIHKFITESNTVKTVAAMTSYTNAIHGTDVKYAMVPIPAGEFTMGSPAGEAKRRDDEGPQVAVKISPFWMGRTEVTWDEYELFMYRDEERKWKESITTDPYVDTVSDAVARPTRPYVEMSFGMGKRGYPAISMTHHAAGKFCQWLSAKTGHFYRLPTEAEWEYACRAGTKTLFSWGDDPKLAKEHAWFSGNSDFNDEYNLEGKNKYQKVAQKKPNPWGLYDMHGNVAEWCLDQYEPNLSWITQGAQDPRRPVATSYPHTVRGGSWDDDTDRLRSAVRRGSNKDWKIQDPQLPKSIWYHTDAQFLGFRVVRPLELPSAEVMQKCWNNGVERDPL